MPVQSAATEHRIHARPGHPEKAVRWAAVSALFLTPLLLGLAQPPFELGALALVALVPWLIALERMALVSTAALSFGVGTLYGAVVGSWIPEALGTLHSSPATAVSGLLATAAWAKGLPFLAAGVGVWGLRGLAPTSRILGTGLLFFAIESVHSSWELGVPYALLGHSQWSVPGVAQLAAVAGVPLVSALLAAVNQAISLTLTPGREARIPLWIAATLLAAWTGLAVAGLPLVQWVRDGNPASAERAVRLLLVQPDIPRGHRWASELQSVHLRRLVSYTAAALAESHPPPDAVLWPENLLTRPLEAEIQESVQRLGVPVITGLVRASPSGDPRTYRSSVLWFEADGELRASLDKVRAVPVLESARDLPGESWLALAFGNAATRWTHVAEAPHAGPLRAGFSIAPVLCYESLFPRLVAARRDDESVAIVSLADDSWVASPTATRQLTAYTSFRAIEQRLPVIRLAHGGLSATIDPFGRMLEALPLDRYAHATATVQRQLPPTLRERIALVGLPLLAGAVVGCGGVLWTRRGSGVDPAEIALDHKEEIG